MLTARGQGELGDSLDTQFVPNCDEVVALEELHFVSDLTGAVGFIVGVLHVPVALLLLDELAYGLLGGGVNALLDGALDLEVLSGIAGLILRRALPGDEKGTLGREAELVDVRNGQVQGRLAAGDFNPLVFSYHIFSMHCNRSSTMAFDRSAKLHKRRGLWRLGDFAASVLKYHLYLPSQSIPEKAEPNPLTTAI